jgi:YbbR domain-containing protein
MKDRISKLWKNFRKEKWLLLLCFLLAFLAWQGIRKNIGFEVLVSDVLVDVSVPDGWAVWEKSVHRVNILFRGSREDIRYLNNGQLRVVIPMTEPKQGDEIHIKLSDKYLKNPTGAKVVRFSPSEIVVKLDQETERLLPVKAAVSGSLPEGLEVDRMVCTPASVRVSGARQVLDGMENIHTASIDLKDRQKSFKESIPIALPQAGRMRVDPDWVSVDFTLVPRSSTQTFDNIPVRILCASGEPRRVVIHPQVIKITVKGQQQRIEQMLTADVFAYVDCAALTENTGYDLPVIVDLPTGLLLVKTDPAVIHVDIGNSN